MAGQPYPAVAPHAAWSLSGLSGGVIASLPIRCSWPSNTPCLHPASRRDGTSHGSFERDRVCASTPGQSSASTRRGKNVIARPLPRGFPPGFPQDKCQEPVQPLFFSLAPLNEKRENAKPPAGLDRGGCN